MSPTTFEVILRRIARFSCMESAESAPGRKSVTTEKKLLTTLWYIGSQETIRSIGHRFNVTDSILLKHIGDNMTCICALPDIIKFPSGQDQVNIVRDFTRMGFPNTIGEIDGSHIAMKAHTEYQISYNNRKGFTAIILQAVCLPDMTFTDLWRVAWESTLCEGIQEFSIIYCRFKTVSTKSYNW